MKFIQRRATYKCILIATATLSVACGWLDKTTYAVLLTLAFGDGKPEGEKKIIK